MRISSDFCLNVNEHRISNSKLTSNLQLFLSNNFQLFSWNQNDRTVNEGGACVYIYFWSNMALGHFPMVKSFSRHIVLLFCPEFPSFRTRVTSKTPKFIHEMLSILEGSLQKKSIFCLTLIHIGAVCSKTLDGLGLVKKCTKFGFLQCF